MTGPSRWTGAASSLPPISSPTKLDFPILDRLRTFLEPKLLRWGVPLIQPPIQGASPGSLGSQPALSPANRVAGGFAPSLHQSRPQPHVVMPPPAQTRTRFARAPPSDRIDMHTHARAHAHKQTCRRRWTTCTYCSALATG